MARFASADMTNNSIEDSQKEFHDNQVHKEIKKKKRSSLTKEQLEKRIERITSRSIQMRWDIVEKKYKKLVAKYGLKKCKEFISSPDCPEDDYGKMVFEVYKKIKRRKRSLRKYKRLLKKIS